MPKDSTETRDGGSLQPDCSAAPPTKRLHRALTGCVWTPWELFTGRMGVTPPLRAEITQEEWEWMWAAVTKQQNDPSSATAAVGGRGAQDQ